VRLLTSILRLGHRPERDKRMTTHVGLTARAFGASSIYLPNLDVRIKKTLEDVTERFGGDFSVEETKDWRKLIDNWKGDVIHLTMYGEDVDTFFKNNKINDPLIIVGAEKVPAEVYDRADYNISIGSQPHSEVAALAVFMDRLNARKLDKNYDGQIGVVPRKKGKKIVDYSRIPSASQCFELMDERNMDKGLMKHTIDVLERTLEIHEQFGGNLKLLIAGALLHDIGRTVTHGVEHGIEGGRIVREQGWEDELARIVERHIGGGITREEAEEQGLPARSFLPETLEEKIICHADNTAGGKERFNDLIDRTKKAGYHDSVKRMKELAKEFDFKK